MLNRLRKRLRAEEGFTLIELLVVMAIIIILVAIAIPNLLTARKTANETRAGANLRTVSTAVGMNVNRTHELPADLAALETAQLIDENLASGNTGGYTYTYELTAVANVAEWTVVAVPNTAGDGLTTFCTDATGAVRSDPTGASTAATAAGGCLAAGFTAIN